MKRTLGSREANKKRDGGMRGTRAKHIIDVLAIPQFPLNPVLWKMEVHQSKAT